MKRITLIMVCFVVIMLGTNANADPYLMVYDGGGIGGIQTAMSEMGFTVVTDYILKGPGDTISETELASVNALIVGWNAGTGDMSGLDADVLDAGITGNILITGHDADWHVVNGMGGTTGPLSDAVDAAATLFLSQAIDFAQEKGGTGLVALADFLTAFDYLPDSWGITATPGLSGDELIEITVAGYTSGVYDGLAGSNMSPWVNSYHNEFTDWDPRFEVFENHYSIDPVPITIGYVVPVPTALLLGLLGLSVAGVKLRKFA